MELPTLTPPQFLFGIVLLGMLLLLCVYIPVQIAAKWRRVRAAHMRIACRICGYRFVRQEEGKSPCRCPHCGAQNK